VAKDAVGTFLLVVREDMTHRGGLAGLSLTPVRSYADEQEAEAAVEGLRLHFADVRKVTSAGSD
jgi:hypothetical protein